MLVRPGQIGRIGTTTRYVALLSATINNTPSNSSLLTGQVSGASALFTNRQADLDARSNAA